MIINIKELFLYSSESKKYFLSLSEINPGAIFVGKKSHLVRFEFIITHIHYLLVPFKIFVKAVHCQSYHGTIIKTGKTCKKNCFIKVYWIRYTFEVGHGPL